jgi:hypothetical protein
MSAMQLSSGYTQSENERWVAYDTYVVLDTLDRYSFAKLRRGTVVLRVVLTINRDRIGFNC